jgi:osmotically inducible protein OsmC
VHDIRARADAAVVEPIARVQAARSEAECHNCDQARAHGHTEIPCETTVVHSESISLSKGETMDKIKPLFTATATTVGGRNGRTETNDGVVKADLSVPKEMGGPGKPGTATPEHLFAAGYAACFGGAVDFVAKQKKRNAANAKVTSAVSIGPREGGGFGIAVKMRVEDKSIPQAELAALVKEAHEKICPYSHATRGNVDVSFEVTGS